jgi:hypothetical protein
MMTIPTPIRATPSIEVRSTSLFFNQFIIDNS